MSHHAARKLKRALVQRALDSKVVVGDIAPVAPPPAPPKPGKEPAMKQILLPMSAEQWTLLLNAQAEVQQASSKVEMILKTCLAQHHVAAGQIVEVRSGTPPKIVVAVPDVAPKKGRKP